MVSDTLLNKPDISSSCGYSLYIASYLGLDFLPTCNPPSWVFVCLEFLQDPMIHTESPCIHMLLLNAVGEGTNACSLFCWKMIT